MTGPWSVVEGTLPVEATLSGFLIGELVHKIRDTGEDFLVDIRLNTSRRDDPQVTIHLAGYVLQDEWDAALTTLQNFAEAVGTGARQLQLRRNGEATLRYFGPAYAITRAELSDLYVERAAITSKIINKETLLAMQEAQCTSKKSIPSLAAASTPQFSTAQAA